MKLLNMRKNVSLYDLFISNFQIEIQLKLVFGYAEGQQNATVGIGN